MNKARFFRLLADMIKKELAHDADTPKEGWVTLKNGTHVYLDENNTVTKGPNVFIGNNITTLDIDHAATKVASTPTKSFDEYLSDNNGNYKKAAAKYYQSEIQGHYVDANINGSTEQVFFSRASHKSGNDLMLYMENKPPKPNLVPMIPDVISTGRYTGEEPPKHLRKDYKMFHNFEKVVEYDGQKYKIKIKVGEIKNGEKYFSFYYFKHNKSTGNDNSLDSAEWMLALRVAKDSGVSARLDPQEGLLGFIIEKVN